MAEPPEDGTDGEHCLLGTPPLIESRRLAKKYDCDLAIPNDAGIGNVIIYTRLVDDLARSRGRALKLLTGRLRPPIAMSGDDDGFAIWRNQQAVADIVDGDAIDPEIMVAVNRERDNLMHFGHMMENVAYPYGLRPTVIRPVLPLTSAECQTALARLSHLPRPLILIHPSSSSVAAAGEPWHHAKWRRLTDALSGDGGMFEVVRPGEQRCSLDIPRFETRLRELFAFVWAADVVVCLDSAVAHVATAYSRSAVVLWDPTRKVAIEERWQRGFSLAALSRWSYPENDNIILIGGAQDDRDVKLVSDRVRRRLASLYA